ncbi:hypothetical protein JOD43_003849 [Pullulanibacillus pueri]|uniref:Aminoglycoside phosphotransferase n=1 Tax=Pullulanibacillus pueri TaxID=1437324 RepID=A0A8J2ZZN4_9BACL|nr:aminoglycoside phosphotransferase family protein [Pullulanibacillus pueri]MBM7683669.1 hypothetical protein [Pullulanibacillus pueri]GGH87165.1 aminoglycoside phosphotransferase [Pullulanibacillus pueri]
MIQEIINELISKQVIYSPIKDVQPLLGGTTSELYRVQMLDGEDYAIKVNEPQVLHYESDFLKYYGGIDLLPKLRYVDPHNKFIVYTYISGSTDYLKGNKTEMLNALVTNLINNYRPVQSEKGWGWVEALTPSWSDFLLECYSEGTEILRPWLAEKDRQFVRDIIKRRQPTTQEPYFLHGDCGVHNFIFQHRQLSGVIDPTPVFGEPLYDLIYAFCSSPDDLTLETLRSAAAGLTIGKVSDDDLIRGGFVGLYLRMATCIQHHPHDLQDYLKAWARWKHDFVSL